MGSDGSPKQPTPSLTHGSRWVETATGRELVVLMVCGTGKPMVSGNYLDNNEPFAVPLTAFPVSHHPLIRLLEEPRG